MILPTDIAVRDEVETVAFLTNHCNSLRMKNPAMWQQHGFKLERRIVSHILSTFFNEFPSFIS